MPSDPIRLILEGAYPDPDGGPPLASPTRSVVIADNLIGMEAEALRGLNLGGRFAVVSDPITHDVLGARVTRALESLGHVDGIRLPDRPRADMATVATIREAAQRADALIAVGSGTINDLCKYAAAQDKKPYAVFPTAPSMNGYTAVNAAITVNGHKQSLPGIAPCGVFIDLKVLAKAPKRMIRSGLGDSLCRCTAQADWLLSHLLLGSKYRNAPFVLLAEDEEALLAEPESLIAGDLEAMAMLARLLVLSGFGMTICGGSHPGSQGEHLISHYIEMMQPSDRPEVFHGEQVGVTTLVMARLQERMLAGAAPRLRPTRTRKASVLAHFGADIGENCWREFDQKLLSSEAAERLNERLEEGWSAIRDRLSGVTRPAHVLEKVLRRAGAPLAHDEIHLSRDFFLKAVRRAREIRNRFTFLDLAADAGRLDPETLL